MLNCHIINMSILSDPKTPKWAKLAEKIQKLKEICSLNYDESSRNLKEIGRASEFILRQASMKLGEIKRGRDDADKAENLDEFESWVREQDVFHNLMKERKRTLLEKSFRINLKEIEIQDEEVKGRGKYDATQEFVKKIKKGLRHMRRWKSYEERKTNEKKDKSSNYSISITSPESTQNRASRGNPDICSFSINPLSHSHSQPPPPPTTQSLLPICTPSNPSDSVTSFISPDLPNDSRPHLPLDTFKLDESLPRGSHNLDPSYRYIFYPEPSSKNLHVFSISTGERFILHISNLADNFYSELSACLLPDFSLFISGGHSNEKVLKTCFIINLNSMDVVYQPEMKSPRCGHCSIYLNNTIYVFGGASGVPKSLLCKSEKFVISQKCWYKIRSLGTRRSRMSPAIYDGKIHIAGGHGAYNYVIYDPILDRYTIKGKLLYRDNPTICLFIGSRVQILQKGVVHSPNYKGILKVKASWVMNSEIYSQMPVEVEQDTGYFFNYDGRIYVFEAEDIPRLVCLTP
jgi:hypothetical protein